MRARPHLVWRDQTDPDTAVEATARTALEAARLYVERTVDLARGSGSTNVLVRDEHATCVITVSYDVEVTIWPHTPSRIVV